MGFKIAWTDHGAYIRFADALTDEDLTDAAHLLMANRDFDRIHYQVLDLQAVSAVTLGRQPEDIAYDLGAGAAGWFCARQRPVAVAFVGGERGLIGIAEAYDKILHDLARPWACRRFDRMHAAFCWVAHHSRHPVTLGARIRWQEYGRYLAPRYRLIRCR